MNHTENLDSSGPLPATAGRRSAPIHLPPIQRRSPKQTILRLLGILLILFSVTMVPPIGVGLLYGDGDVTPFAWTSFLTLSIGVFCWWPVRTARVELRNRDGFLIVVTFWIGLSILAALPFMLAERPHSSLAASVFEAVSGLTTTGATVLSHLDALPHSILYYRAQLNFLGGMGIVVLAVALLPLLGVGGMQLYKAETPGPMKDEKLTPRITETAKNLWYVYVGLNFLCALAFWGAGMSLFDAVAHSLSTMALGGFSTHDASIGYFNSSLIELIAGFFSFVAGINVALHFVAWRRRSLAPILSDPEFRCYYWVMLGLVLTVCSYLYLSGKFPLWESIYHGFFQTMSITTDNGLVTAGYPEWPTFVPLLLLLASFFGGCVGSTCGGIKAMRFLLLYKQSVREIKMLIRPNQEVTIKLGDRPMSDQVIGAVWGFYFLYILAYCIFSVLLVFCGNDMVTAFGSVGGCMNNMGVGLGKTASNFGPLNDASLWILSLSMLVGRLEVFPLLLIFLPDFWR